MDTTPEPPVGRDTTARAGEIRSAGRLVGDALAGLVDAIGHVHLAVADRVFDALGPGTAPARDAHDRFARGTYAAVRAGNAALPRVGAAVASVTGAARTASWHSAPRASMVLATINGLRGDWLAEHHEPLATTMSLRDPVGNVEVAITRAALAAAHPDATDRVVVFVHGLCETDRSWLRPTDGHPGELGATYGSRLADELGCTPLYVRYNSGLHVADNGRSLADLLGQVVEAWPTEVTELVLVGHSMGGLVIRSACHQAHEAGEPWTERVRHVVCLGTPHLGAPLERAVHSAVGLLARLPETQPLAPFLADRSAGVRDLRHGIVATSTDGDDMTDQEVPFLAGATYWFVAATVSRDRHHPLGRMVGDLLVQYPSAAGAGRTRRIPFELDNGAHVGGITHFALLNHPEVYEHLYRWLTPTS